MPKLKTKKIVRARFKITKTGKVLHRVQGRRHLRRKKSKARQRRQDAHRQITLRKSVRMIRQYINT